jgi:hypothetical protein
LSAPCQSPVVSIAATAKDRKRTHLDGVFPAVILLHYVDGLFHIAQNNIAVAVISLIGVSVAIHPEKGIDAHEAGP